MRNQFYWDEKPIEFGFSVPFALMLILVFTQSIWPNIEASWK